MTRGLPGTPVLKWQRGGCFASWCQTGWYSSPAVADLDGDGQPGGDLGRVRPGGAQRRDRQPSSGAGPTASRIWPGIAVADLTGDGTQEVIVGRGGDQVTVYDRHGRRALDAQPVRRRRGAHAWPWRTSRRTAGSRSSRAAPAAGATRQLNVFDADGNVRPGWPARRDGEPGYGWGMYNENVAVGRPERRRPQGGHRLRPTRTTSRRSTGTATSLPANAMLRRPARSGARWGSTWTTPWTCAATPTAAPSTARTSPTARP